MAPKFKVKVLQTSKILKNTTIISVVLLSFFLILFSKSDIYLLNSIKNFSTTFIHPITKVISSPFKIISNLANEYQKNYSMLQIII